MEQQQDPMKQTEQTPQTEAEPVTEPTEVCLTSRLQLPFNAQTSIQTLKPVTQTLPNPTPPDTAQEVAASQRAAPGGDEKGEPKEGVAPESDEGVLVEKDVDEPVLIENEGKTLVEGESAAVGERKELETVGEAEKEGGESKVEGTKPSTLQTMHQKVEQVKGAVKVCVHTLSFMMSSSSNREHPHRHKTHRKPSANSTPPNPPTTSTKPSPVPPSRNPWLPMMKRTRVLEGWWALGPLILLLRLRRSR